MRFEVEETPKLNPSTHSRARELGLAPHVHACHSEGQVILLDLQRDKYLAIGGTQTRSLSGLIDGWPTGPVPDGMPAASTDISSLTKRLLLQGLVTDKPRSDERLPVVSLPEAVATLGDEDPGHGVRIGVRRLTWFLHSVTAAATSLRCRSLLAVVRRVAARRARLGTTRPGQLPLEAARDAVAAYERLRPLVFTARDACLFDSLALLNFLAYEGMFPSWVIGVKTRPFGAHSWVQSEGIVLNDLHEHVRAFTPILIV